MAIRVTKMLFVTMTVVVIRALVTPVLLETDDIVQVKDNKRRSIPKNTLTDNMSHITYVYITPKITRLKY